MVAAFHLRHSRTSSLYLSLPPRAGTGLGLVISHRIITERHHGMGSNGTQFNVRGSIAMEIVHQYSDRF
jgi:signal transduction histidine kinase